MEEQRGSALAVVLLILAVLGLLGAGLMVQTRYDTKVMSAQGSYDKMLNLADGSAKYSLFVVKGGLLSEPGYLGRPALAPLRRPDGKLDTQTVTNLGDWTALAWFLGPDTSPWAVPGFEPSLYYSTGWLSKGSATQQKLDSSFEVDQTALFDPSKYEETQRQQVYAQSAALVSATKITPKE